MVKYTVIGGNLPVLARKIARRLKADYVKADQRIFPDGEQKSTLSSVPKNNVIIVQSTSPPVDTNFIQVLSLVYKSREYSDRVFAVIPYMGYARQDKEFLPGEIITIKVIAKLLRAAGASKIFIVDIHSQTALKQLKVGVNVSAIPDLVKHIKKLKLRDPLVVSPDAGGTERAKQFAQGLGVEFIALQKKRDRKTGEVKIISSNQDEVKNRDLILVDDMISTGGSIIKATKFLKKQGCKRVYVACTHALLINDAKKKIQQAGVTSIISANTVDGPTSIVDVSGAISQAILEQLSGKGKR